MSCKTNYNYYFYNYYCTYFTVPLSSFTPELFQVNAPGTTSRAGHSNHKMVKRKITKKTMIQNSMQRTFRIEQQETHLKTGD